MQDKKDEKGIVETKVFVTNLKALFKGYRLIGNKGGTWSGKTFGFLIALAVFLFKTPDRRKATVIGQTGDELRDGAYQDWENIMDILPLGRCINKTSRIWKVGRSTVVFQSLDKPGKAKSGKRDIVFVNEANHIDWEIIKHLLLRCNVFAFDWNPSSKFWFQSQILPNLESYTPNLLTKTTYKDNPACPTDIIRGIESLTGSDYDIYALANEAQREGLIYKFEEMYDPMPSHATNKAGFLDFGFTNDVTAFGEASIEGDDIYAQEHFYKTGLLTKDIDKELQNIGWSKSTPIVCDRIPKDVAELRAYGWYLIETDKFAGSVRFGINVLRQYNINIHYKSANLKEELENYEWIKKYGEVVKPEQPVDKFNHLLDGLRYYAMKFASAKVLQHASRRRVGVEFNN
jgi:phage terminase large subunit